MVHLTGGDSLDEWPLVKAGAVQQENCGEQWKERANEGYAST